MEREGEGGLDSSRREESFNSGMVAPRNSVAITTRTQGGAKGRGRMANITRTPRCGWVGRLIGFQLAMGFVALTLGVGACTTYRVADAGVGSANGSGLGDGSAVDGGAAGNSGGTMAGSGGTAGGSGGTYGRHFRPADGSSGAVHACARIYRQKSLNRSGDSSVYRTVCWMFL